jgi:hypothetical protein
VLHVIGELGSEYIERTRDQPRRSVGMAAGAASTRDRAEMGKAVRGAEISGPGKHLLERRGQRVEPEDAWPALTGALRGKPSRNPRRLGETARVL